MKQNRGRRTARSIYYYTDFSTLNKIFQNGTLRFKESTSSNDILDTIQFYARFGEMAENWLQDRGLGDEWNLFVSTLNQQENSSTRVSLVACFSLKSDSRLLWDAYTMNRKGRHSDRYNGVCMEFDADALKERMDLSSTVFDYRSIKQIVYGFERVKSPLEKVLYNYSVSVSKKSDKQEQLQEILRTARASKYAEAVNAELKKSVIRSVLELKNQLDKIAPFYKHEFWNEEAEVRALLSVKRELMDSTEVRQDKDGALYYDVPIDSSCIRKMILGPEFSKDDYSQLESINGKIRIDEIRTEQSKGTGVITNK